MSALISNGLSPAVPGNAPIRRVAIHRGFTIWATGGNFAVEQPDGFYFDDLAANKATAIKWIDAELAARPREVRP